MLDSGIDDGIREKAQTDGRYATAFALLKVAESLNRLGNGDACAGGMGATEGLAMMVRAGLDSPADAVDRK